MFTSLLNAEMTILSTTIGPDAFGGWTVTGRSTVGSFLPCRVNVLSEEMRTLLMRDGVVASHTVFCDGDVTIEQHWELVCNGATYLVLNIKDFDELGHHLTLTVRRNF